MSICRETICTHCLHKDVCCFKGAFLETLAVLQDEVECINIESITCKYRIGKCVIKCGNELPKEDKNVY